MAAGREKRSARREKGMDAEKVKQGHLGPSASKGLFDYGGRSEEEILRKRDILYLKLLDLLESQKAFGPV